MLNLLKKSTFIAGGPRYIGDMSRFFYALPYATPPPPPPKYEIWFIIICIVISYAMSGSQNIHVEKVH